MKQQRNSVEKKSIKKMTLMSKHLTKLRLLSKISFVILLFIISYIAFLPNYEKLPELTSLSDVLNHFLAFFVLALFLDIGFQVKVDIAFSILFVYGLFIEFVQYFLPNRHFDLLDILVDLTGFIFYLIIKKLFFSVI